MPIYDHNKINKISNKMLTRKKNLTLEIIYTFCAGALCPWSDEILTV